MVEILKSEVIHCFFQGEKNLPPDSDLIYMIVLELIIFHVTLLSIVC